MKILNVIKCEFIKNYTLPKIIIALSLLMFFSIIMIEDHCYQENLLDSIQNQIDLEEHVSPTGLESGRELTLLHIEFNEKHKEKVIENYHELEKIVGSNFENSNWQHLLTRRIIELEDYLLVIEQLINNSNSSFDAVMEEVDEFIQSDMQNDVSNYVKVLGIIKSKNKDLEELKREYLQELTNCKNILKENKFYQYVEYQLTRNEKDSNIKREVRPYYQKIVELKIENEFDYRAENVRQLNELSEEFEIIPKEEWVTFGEMRDGKPRPYESYLRNVNFYNSMKKEFKEILIYSIEHELKHDLDSDVMVFEEYQNTKYASNQVLSISFVVLIIVILTSGGIISQEHSTKTDKFLLTSPIKRWKVFLGKFLYLILHTYFIWIFAFFIIFIYSGIRFGFTDLFTPKLVYYGGKVHEVNYILHMLKMILINGIPLLAILAILIFLSTITLNTAVATGITIIPAVLSIFLWNFICQFKLFFLVYTPIPYIRLVDIQISNGFYVSSLEYVNVNAQLGLFVSIITIIICYIISNIVYVKRDIKN